MGGVAPVITSHHQNVTSSGDILIAAYNLPVWDQSSDWWRVYGTMAGRVLKRIARENVDVSLTLPFNCEFAPRSATQSVEKSAFYSYPERNFGWNQLLDSSLSLFSTLWVADRGANSRLKGKLAGSEAHIDILPCNSSQHSARHKPRLHDQSVTEVTRSILPNMHWIWA